VAWTPPSRSADDSSECSICGSAGAGGTMQTSFLSEIIDGFSGNSLPFHLQPLVEVPSLRRGENPGTCYRQYQLSLIKLNFSVA
jgi:hypothetical protein